jgi:alcohol dehydrogenase class IV
MRFEFGTATRIIFGPGTFGELGKIVREFSDHAVVVSNLEPAALEPLAWRLRESGLHCSLFGVRGEPEIETVRQGVAQAKQENCGVVVSIGGGSALDAGKAIAAMLTNPGELLDYLEVVGRGQALTRPGAPFIAVPTTAGTGAEVTRNAVLASPEHKFKVSLRSPFLLAKVALVDPKLTYDLPPAITASTGLDALTQVIEPYVCSRPNPMTDALCVEGIRRAARSLQTAFEKGRDPAARLDMSVTSLFGGLALANAGLGAVHGFAAPIGGQFHAPHGAVCAALLPHVMEANVRALRQRQPAAEPLRRYDEVARLVTGSVTATAEAGIEWVCKLVTILKIPGLGQYGLKREHTAELVGKAALASSMKANPITLKPEELAWILERAR